ncbi:MAG: tetratricopeptide repeat protein [Syntrophales bacterium]
MRKIAVLYLSFVFIVMVIPDAFCQPPVTLQEGIGQYKQENYEEAIEILTKVREQDPMSSMAAFYLGMAYKQTVDYSKASVNLEDAVKLTPYIKDAVVELIDMLYQLNRLEEAEKWVKVAEKEEIFPPRVAFLSGLIFSKENRNQDAIEAFERAKKIDPTLAQPSEFQIALCYMKDRKLDKAKERFQAVVLQDPLSDLAGFARQYQDTVEKRMYLERPLRLTISIIGGYDTNIVQKPIEQTIATGITGEESGVLQSSVRLDYVPVLEGPWLFNARYALASSVNEKHTHSHDSMANTFSVSPGYNFGRFAINLTASYTNVLLRTDPDASPPPDSAPGYKRYLDYLTYGPTFRTMITQNNILELFAGYDKKNYFNQAELGPEQKRNSEGPRTYISWVWLFKENAFLNLRYDFNKEHADGIAWENAGNRFTFNLIMPILPADMVKWIGPLNLQLTGSAYFQDYKYEIDYGITSEKRKDKIYTGSVGLTWEFCKYANFILQYARTRSDSNVPLYEYNRNLYTTGFEFRF